MGIQADVESKRLAIELANDLAAIAKDQFLSIISQTMALVSSALTVYITPHKKCFSENLPFSTR
jgi:hypothetical protein